MAAMSNGDKGEEVCNALRQRVATAFQCMDPSGSFPDGT
jgi:hypothetical protein